jgi:hypothetical protein
MDDSPNSHINGSNKKHIKGKLPKPKKLTPIEGIIHNLRSYLSKTKIEQCRQSHFQA